MLNPVDGKISGNIRSPSGGISGNISSGGSVGGRVLNGGGSRVLTNTTEGWNSQASLISVVNTLYVYSDHHVNREGQPMPAFKIGDGTTYLIDLPFNDDLMVEHINDTGIHITEEERQFWNNKNRAVVAGENLVLTAL